MAPASADPTQGLDFHDTEGALGDRTVTPRIVKNLGGGRVEAEFDAEDLPGTADEFAAGLLSGRFVLNGKPSRVQ